MERLTRMKETAAASPANSHCPGRKPNGCCGEQERSNRDNLESISGLTAGGKNDRIRTGSEQ